MKSKQSSKFLAKLAEPQRLTKSEACIKSLAAWVTNPRTNSLIQTMQAPPSWEYCVPQTLSTNCKTGLRVIDAIRTVSMKTTGIESSATVTELEVFEWKTGVVSPHHVRNTVFLKDYGNCYLNGGVKIMRSHETPWRDIVKRIPLILKRNPKIDLLTYLIIGDRLAKMTIEEVREINSYGKYIVHHSSGRHIPIHVKVMTAYEYFKDIHNEYGFSWNQDTDWCRQVDSFSRVGYMNDTFPILDSKGHHLNKNGKSLYWSETNLLPL